MNKSKYRGVTLISLVVTIIILLILLAVTITIIVNSDFINEAEYTKNQAEQYTDEELTMKNDIRNLYK